MDPARFDRLTTALATRALTRRRTLAAGTALLGGLLGAWRGARAQPATPAATPGATVSPELAANNSTLFVQTATGGSFQPNAAASATPTSATPTTTSARGAYRLTLQGHNGETIAFSDRPARNFGEVQTAKFFASMGFTPANPPNAALVVDSPAQTGDILLVELLTPAYDAGSQTLTYEANILTDYQGELLKPLAAKQQDQRIAPQFTNASLFIDDCPDADPLSCWINCGTTVGDLGDQGMCWSWSDFRCEPCNGGYGGTAQACNQKYPSACNGTCFTDQSGTCG